MQLLKKYLSCEKRNKRPFNKRNYPKPKLRLRVFFGDQKHYICGQTELQNSGINIGVGREKAAVCVFSYGKQALLKKKTIIVHVFFFCSGLVTICHKTKRLLMCFNKLARPTSTNEVFSPSHLV